jgi:uncharacterized protein YkwD
MTLALRLLAPVAGPRRLTLLVALAFGVTSLGVLTAPGGALAWDANSYSSGSETLLISMQNQARAGAGLKALKQDTALRTVARWRSKDMIERDYFSHTIKGTTRNVFWYLQHKYDYCFKVAGENIGTVSWKGASEEDATKWVFDQFMNSSGHRSNIMGKAWDVVGVGAYKTTGDKFMWTVIFADRCSTTATATPKPTPKPTPRPTPKPTPRPTPKPTARPTPRSTKAPVRATPRPTPRPTARPTAKPTAKPAPVPTATPSVQPTFSPSVPPTPLVTPSPSAGPTPTPRPTPPNGVVPPGQLRIIDQAAGQGLLDSILQSINAQFFGT